MSKFCQITGKRSLVGNNVAHSNKRTKRLFKVNLFSKRFFLADENRWVDLKVSAKGIKIITKKGLKVALQEAIKKGYIANY